MTLLEELRGAQVKMRALQAVTVGGASLSSGSLQAFTLEDRQSGLSTKCNS